MEDLLKPEGSDRRVFLLGGADLEMLEIKKLLDTEKIDYCDNHLGWSNAILSSYDEQISRYEQMGYEIYGVELRSDRAFPKKYTPIDHHNEYNGRRSSLEQVAELLGVSLTRYQTLVAANDSAYIPGMLDLGATDEEIFCVRKNDRAAQGVTEVDERKAEVAITENMVVHKGVTVVKSDTSRFSCICDRLYGNDSLLVYTDSEWTYYGKFKLLLKEHFSEEINRGNIYFGGTEQGFIGLGQGIFPKDRIELMVKEIIDLTNNA